MTTPVVFKTPLINYAPPSTSPFKGAEAAWLTNELQKLQRAVVAINAALNQLAQAV